LLFGERLLVYGIKRFFERGECCLGIHGGFELYAKKRVSRLGHGPCEAKDACAEFLSDNVAVQTPRWRVAKHIRSQIKQGEFGIAYRGDVVHRGHEGAAALTAQHDQAFAVLYWLNGVFTRKATLGPGDVLEGVNND